MRRVLALLSSALLVGALAACGASDSDQRTVTIFLLGETEDGPELVRAEVQASATDSPALDAVSALLSYDADESGQLMGWDPCTGANQAVAVDVDDDLVTVDLHREGRTEPGICDFDEQGHRAWVQQMVWTVQEATGVALPVRVTVDGVEQVTATSRDPRVKVRG